jgi:hypothetical protein
MTPLLTIPNLQARFDDEYNDDSYNEVARFTLLDETDSDTQQELVTAIVYFNGNEYAVAAWTFERLNKLIPSDVRVSSIGTDLNGDIVNLSLLVHIDSINKTYVPLSETIIRMLIAEARRHANA